MGDVDQAGEPHEQDRRPHSALERVRGSRAAGSVSGVFAWAGSLTARLWRGDMARWGREFEEWRYTSWERFKEGPVAARLAYLGRGGRRMWRWARGNRGVRRGAIALALMAVALVGSVLGVTLAGKASIPIGPFQSSLEVQPSVTGETWVALPPLGSLTLDSHTGPLKLSVSLDSLDQARTQALVADPDGLNKASATVAEDLISGLISVALRAAAGAALAGLVLGGLLFRSVRRSAICGALSLALTVAVVGLAAGTLRPQSIEEPRYEGLLANAPAVVGDARKIADRYEEYRAQLQRMVTNAAQLYTTASTLPTFDADPNTVRILHVSDLHLNPSAWSVIGTVVEQFQIEAVVDTGDITDWGTEQEAKAYTSSIGALPVPYIYIRGNHDSEATAKAVAAQDNAIVLDGDTVTVAGLTFAGIGDPRFTPDKTSAPGDLREEQVMYNSGAELADVVEDSDVPVDVCLVHDPVSAGPLADLTPLVLSGHRHAREVTVMPDSTTRLMVQGSTGGAGLRGLEGDTPTPLELSVLYFSKDDRSLQAYDDITLGGAGQTEVTLQRNVIDGIADGVVPPPQTDPSAPSAPAPSGS
ncbi:metallophosphoesterase [Phytomonospora sp. NPDC050363]|uniref:metallophosphoesterase family protein n=1 Tax=Phytomonospora sp. NPDC050363 TaxID=3155642 RepID=UPI0033D61C08